MTTPLQLLSEKMDNINPWKISEKEYEELLKLCRQAVEYDASYPKTTHNEPINGLKECIDSLKNYIAKRYHAIKP